MWRPVTPAQSTRTSRRKHDIANDARSTSSPNDATRDRRHDADMTSESDGTHFVVKCASEPRMRGFMCVQKRIVQWTLSPALAQLI